MTVKSAVAELPAASLAVAVQTTVVLAVTAGAVNVLPEKLPPLVQLNVGPVAMPTLSLAVKVDVPVAPETTERAVGLKERLGACVSGTGAETVTVKSAVPELPAASLAVAVQTTVVLAVTAGAVNVLPEKLPPFVQLKVGPVAMPTLSVAVKVDVPVPPETTESAAGLKDRLGASVSGTGAVIVTVKVAELEFPAASPTVAVHTLVVSAVTAGAVKVLPEKLPPLVQLTVGPDVTRTLSVVVKVAVPVPPEATVRVAALNDTEGDVVSATGVGAVTDPLEDDDPPPHATPPSAIIASALTFSVF